MVDALLVVLVHHLLPFDFNTRHLGLDWLGDVTVNDDVLVDLRVGTHIHTHTEVRFDFFLGRSAALEEAGGSKEGEEGTLGRVGGGLVVG